MEEKIEDSEWMTQAELARALHFSVDTIRRHFVAGKLSSIEHADFLENGKLRFKRDSVEAFMAARVAAAKKIYTRSAQNSRALEAEANNG